MRFGGAIRVVEGFGGGYKKIRVGLGGSLGVGVSLAGVCGEFQGAIRGWK